jgi:hypothetical protein
MSSVGGLSVAVGICIRRIALANHAFCDTKTNASDLSPTAHAQGVIAA